MNHDGSLPLVRFEAALVAFLAAPLLAGCLSADLGGLSPDEAARGAFQRVEYLLPDTASGLDFVGLADNRTAEGMAVHDDRIYVSGPSGLRIVDIADPQRPVTVASDVPDTASADVDVFDHADGRTYAVLARGGKGAGLVDVTDPTAPLVMATIDLDAPDTHTVAAVPGHPIVYVSRSVNSESKSFLPREGTGPAGLHSGTVDILDFTDLLNPKVMLFQFPAVATTVDGGQKAIDAIACHEITFTPERQRAYCAGITQTMVWDVSDPLRPVILQVLDAPLTNIHHLALPARGGDLLILGDEFAGVLAPTPMCNDKVATPTSALWFWDISDLAKPRPVGYFQVPYDGVAASLAARKPLYCSTHDGSVVDGKDWAVFAWYTAGTVLVDFSDPAAPRLLAHHHVEGTRSMTWEARYANGHVFSSVIASGAPDAGVGLQVLQIV